MSEKNVASTDQRFGRLGGWLPSKQDHLKTWLTTLKKSAATRDAQLQPVMVDFKNLVDTNPIVRMQLDKMIAEVPEWLKSIHDDTFQNAYLTSVDEMIFLINDVLTTAPEFNETELVGCPINAILDWCMGTPSGCAAFANEIITNQFRQILKTWNQFLLSEDSRYVIAPEFESRHEQGVVKKGWMCPEAVAKLHMEDYNYKPTEKYWGFSSWNDFFTRTLVEGARPIDGQGQSNVIVSSCDSTVFQISHDVQPQSNFWIKDQPYSLNDMLYNNPLANQFVGGDVYQAFLSACDYHRWHSPVGGTIKSVELIDGTYYSEAESEGFDPGGPDRSQGYISHVATRAIVYIEADDPSIGLMAVIFIGMAEISSCVFAEGVYADQPIKKGAPLGFFQFGGSTHCLLFRKDAGVKFVALKDEKPVVPGDRFSVGNQIALATGSSK